MMDSEEEDMKMWLYVARVRESYRLDAYNFAVLCIVTK